MRSIVYRGDNFPKPFTAMTMGLRRIQTYKPAPDFTIFLSLESCSVRAKRVPKYVMSQFLLLKSQKWLFPWTCARRTAGSMNIATSEYVYAWRLQRILPSSMSKTPRVWKYIKLSFSFPTPEVFSPHTLLSSDSTKKGSRTMNGFRLSASKRSEHSLHEVSCSFAISRTKWTHRSKHCNILCLWNTRTMTKTHALPCDEGCSLSRHALDVI